MVVSRRASIDFPASGGPSSTHDGQDACIRFRLIRGAAVASWERSRPTGIGAMLPSIWCRKFWGNG